MSSYGHTSREFLPLSVIRSACAGDTDAVEQVLQHYRGYINKLCTGILYDKHGQPHVCIPPVVWIIVFYCITFFRVVHLNSSLFSFLAGKVVYQWLTRY